MATDTADGDADAEAPSEGADGDTPAAETDTATVSDPTPDSDASGIGARSVTVPTRVYKSVTVFSTLFAVLCVVGGFVVLDVATNRASVSLANADPVLALAGIGLIVLGTVSYAFSTRFQAEEMGNAKDDDDEPSNNG
jgi:hypothetical protein